MIKIYLREINREKSAVSFCKIAYLFILRSTCDTVLSMKNKVLMEKVNKICTMLVLLIQMNGLFNRAMEERAFKAELLFVCVSEGAYVRPEMKFTRNESLLRHEKSSVYISFHFSSEMKFRICQNKHNEITLAMSFILLHFMNSYKRLTRNQIENISFCLK